MKSATALYNQDRDEWYIVKVALCFCPHLLVVVGSPSERSTQSRTRVISPSLPNRAIVLRSPTSVRPSVGIRVFFPTDAASVNQRLLSQRAPPPSLTPHSSSTETVICSCQTRICFFSYQKITLLSIESAFVVSIKKIILMNTIERMFFVSTRKITLLSG